MWTSQKDPSHINVFYSRKKCCLLCGKLHWRKPLKCIPLMVSWDYWHTTTLNGALVPRLSFKCPGDTRESVHHSFTGTYKCCCRAPLRKEKSKSNSVQSRFADFLHAAAESSNKLIRKLILKRYSLTLITLCTVGKKNQTSNPATHTRTHS